MSTGTEGCHPRGKEGGGGVELCASRKRNSGYVVCLWKQNFGSTATYSAMFALRNQLGPVSDAMPCCQVATASMRPSLTAAARGAQAPRLCTC